MPFFLFALPLQAPSPYAFLVGEWESHEETKLPDGSQVPFTLKGVNKLILENQALQMDEFFEVQGQKISNHILMSGAADGTVNAWWFSSSQANRPLTFSGKRDGNTLTLTSPSGLRIVYVILEDGKYDARLERKGASESEYSVLTTAHYQRIQKQKAAGG